MKYLTWFTALALVGLLAAAPTSNKDDGLVVLPNFYTNDMVIYRSKHEIINILVPLNSLNFDESESSESEEEDSDILLFFVEADVKTDGTQEYKGLYVLQDGKATKLLEHGTDAAASGDDSRLVFFGAKDGIYLYNQSSNSADKYGSINDSIIGIAKEKTGDVIYILTEDREVYKVSDNGEAKVKLDDIVNATEIVLDYSNNVYFLSDDKKPYVRTADGVKEVEGFEDELSYAKLVKPPFILDNAVPFVADNIVYILYSNATYEQSDIDIVPKARPTAYAPEAALIQYYAHKKKIYEVNLLKVLLESGTDFNDYLTPKAEDIEALASKTKPQAA